MWSLVLWRPKPTSRSARRSAIGAAKVLPVAVLAGLLLAEVIWAATVRRSLDGGQRASINDQQEIFLEAPPLRGEGLWAFVKRFTGSTSNTEAIRSLNGRPRRLLRGVRYKIPYELLREEHKLRVARALFAEDRAVEGGWAHKIDHQNRGQSLWHIATWFTGQGENFAKIRSHNRLRDNSVHPGQVLVIPERLLLPVFRREVAAQGLASQPAPPRSPPPAEPSSPPIKTTAATIRGHRLDYVGEGDDRFAIYRLQRGEALYSSVVVRFTGRTIGEDVNRLAGEIATLNGIRDVTDMAVGQAVKIPFELLTAEFLPPEDPRRQEWEQVQAAAAKYGNTVRATRLEGITVVLDAGHGGVDPGTASGSMWESVYVYDIMVRMKELLERTTAARVVPTVRDGKSFQRVERDVLPLSRGHQVLTTPAYAIAEPKVATNLRWYLANSVHRQVSRQSDDGKIIFISLHADSRHPSMRGAMGYIPATSLRTGEFGRSTTVYTSRKEVRERPRVSFSWKERTRSEGLSRQLASKLMASFSRHSLPVAPEKPIRDRVIRSRRWVYVPAVLRYNSVPAKVLFEVANMNNADDRRQLQTRAYRQRMAEALVEGILDYYGQAPSGSSTRVAAPP